MKNKLIQSAILTTFVFLSLLSIPSKTEATFGILRVCKMIVSDGNIVTSKNNLPNSTFSIKISPNKDFSNIISNDVFETSNFTPNSALVFENNFYDSVCVNHTVSAGNYYYSQEVISGNESLWDIPKYYDGQNSYNVLNLASNYSNQLFTEDTNDDVLVNISADGFVSIPVDGVRTVIVLNNLKKEPAVCNLNSELLKNGNFDLVPLPLNSKWTLFPWNTPNLGWTSNDTSIYGLEVQGGHTEDSLPWLAHSGNQYAEIDAGPNNQSLLQNIPTIIGKTYTFSLAYSARPHQSNLDNKMQVKVDGVVLDTLVADGLNLTNTSWNQKTYTFTATKDVTKIELFDIGQDNSPSGYGMLVDSVSLKCNPDAPKPNTPPLISLIGLNPSTITVGQVWNEPGATSTDKEDGDLTNKIIITGSVNPNIAGTYTLTYTVTDSGGLSASTTRTVIVEPVKVCNLLDIDKFKGEYLASYKTFGNLIQNGTTTDSVYSLGGEVDFLGSDFTNPDSRAYIKEQVNGLNFSFDNGPASLGKVLIVWDGNDNDYNNINYTGLNHYNLSFNGQRNVIKFSYRSDFADNKDIKFTFTIYSDSNNASKATVSLYGESKIIHNGEIKLSDFVKSIGNGANMTDIGAITLEVDATSRGGHDFTFGNLQMPCGEIPKNTPPVITLVGNNPLELFVDTVFVDPFATASDLEDGNITSNIIRTGQVNASTTGTYTLTYTVTDSGGLSASTTRTVIVKPKIQTTFNIQASKIVCDKEEDLPNWSSTNNDISSTTVVNFLASHPKCHLEPNWKFQWGYSNVKDPGDSFIGEANSSLGWNTFGPTNQDGIASVSVTASSTSDRIWVREVLKENYIPFTFKTTNSNVSAEMYCNTDVENYDNYDFIINPQVGQTYYCVAFNALKKDTPPVNTPPLISLIGLNPSTITVGQVWNEPGATSTDKEDGDLTNKIIITGSVNPNIAGTYTLTYTVTDSGGLSASTTRTVIVEPLSAPVKGKINVCLVLADTENNIATTSTNLPFGVFSISLSKTNDFNNPFASTTWKADTFNPNVKTILNSSNDSSCVSFTNLDLTDYYYSELSLQGSSWNKSGYNDGYNQPVNNIFDFANYSPELFTATTTDDANRNANTDGRVELNSSRKEHTIYVLAKYNKPSQCLLPEVTSSLSAQAVSGQQFSYQITATSTATTTLSFGLSTTTSNLPAGLSYSTTTNTISGIPTETGIFTVKLFAKNSCGTNEVTMNIVVNAPPGGGGGGGGGCTSNCGGGGGGGGGPILPSLKIFNEKVVEITPGVALVTWDTNLSATRQVGYGTVSNPTASSTAPFGYATSTSEIKIPLEVKHSMTILIESGKTYYFRPVSRDTSSMVIGKELVLNPVAPASGGGGGSPNQCYYLFDYLKQGWNNNPVEVKKLQVFLRDLEGFNVDITGVYDNQTVVSLNAFQNRYKDDILTPWGHTAPTSFTYITTKKKVNEIYCKRAFPLTVEQQNEVDAFRKLLESLRSEGIEIPQTPTVEDLNKPIIIDTNEVGLGEEIISTSTNNINLTTLAGSVSTTSKNIASSLTATVIKSGQALKNLLISMFNWPRDIWGKIFDGEKSDMCMEDSCVRCSWFNWLLILIIAFLGYLLYREKRAYRKISEINKEIDLLK